MGYNQQAKIPVFDGNTDFYDFIIYFECIARVEKWTSEEKAAHLLYSLRGNAVTVLGSIQEDLQTDYSTLKDALQKRFTTKFDLDLNGSAYENRTKSSDENYLTYVQDLKKLFWISYGRNWTQEQVEILIREKFFKSIEDTNLKCLVWARNPQNVDEAAMMADSLQFLHSQLERTQSTDRMVDLSWDEKSVSSCGDERPIKRKQRKRRKKTTKIKTCYVCHSKGHLVKYCPEVIPVKKKVKNDEEETETIITVGVNTNMGLCGQEKETKLEKLCTYKTSLPNENTTCEKIDTDNLQHNLRRKRCYICHQRNHFMRDNLQIKNTDL